MPRQYNSRSYKLHEQTVVEAERLAKSGMTREHTARALGIAPSTYSRWLEIGENAEDEEKLERKLYDRVLKAEGEAIARNVALVQKAAQDGNWQAAAWWLERRYPNDYARKERLDIQERKNVKYVAEFAGRPPKEE
jgi:transcriptional regulator with XRE-family HTH domain